MLGKNNFYMNQKKSGRKFQKYSIKKLKVGAASVLVGAGFFLGFHVEASEVNEPATNEVVSSSTKEQKEKASEAPKAVATNEEKINQATPSVDNKLVEEKNANVAAEEQPSTIVEKTEQPSVERKATVETSQLADKMTALQEQVTRIRSNKKQKSFIEKAEKLLEEAKALQTSSNATQKEVDAKVKEISTLTSILKSIKAEEVSKENKNQDSRNGKKIEEGTGFRTGVTDQALTGSIHFDTSKGPTEKRIPVANNGMGERVINMAITYSASSNDTVTDGKVRVTIPKAFLHSNKKPVFTNSSFVKSTDDRSTATDYVYDLNLNPMSGGSVAESLLKLYVGTSIKNAPSKDDSLPVKTEFISGENVLSTKTATATFDYLSEIIYRENDTREKLVKNYLPQEQREYKLGSVVDGKLTPVKTPFRIPLIMTNDRFFNNREADEFNQNGNGRLTSYDYTISGIPEFLELDPTSPKNSKWTLENGVATLHPDQTRGIDQMLYYAGPVLRLKEGALSTPEEIAKVIETNGTKGYSAKIIYNAVGHRPDGSSFMQSLENPDGFRIYAGDGAPAIGMMEDRINATTDQRLFSNASNVDTFGTTYRLPLNNLKTDGGTLPSQYLSYFIPKDQEGNYFTKFKLTQIFTNESENGSSWVRGYHSGYKDVRSQFKENFQLYGVNENNQAELIKDYTTIDELFNETIINSDKRYHHLILKTPGIVDEVQDKGQASKTILGLTSDLDVTVGTWKEKAKDPTIQRYENKISQVLSASNTIESAIATERPNTGSSTPAVHTKKPTTLSLGMQQIGDQELTKDNLTRGKNIPIAVQYTATDYFKLAESEKNGIKVYDLDKLDSNINKTSVMLLADPKLPLKDFRLTADNRLLSKNTLYFGGVNGSAAKDAYNQIKESYDTVNPTRIIENYKGTGKRAYIFESEDLGLSSYDLNRDGWIKGGTYNPVALTFEVENNGQIESGTYNIESYLVWNSDSATLFGNDRSLNANYVEGHEPGSTIAKSNINVTMNNVIEYSTSLTISKPGTTGTRGIIDVKNGQEVILSPQVENLTDTPQKIKEAVVLIPKSEAVTYLEGPIVNNSDEYDVVYTTSTATDKTTGTYVTADQITNWKDVTAVKYVFKNDYTVTKEHGFTHNFNLRVDADNPNFVESTSQIFLKNNQNVWLESNTVGLRTEDVRGKLEVRYINNRKDDILPKITGKEFAGQPYTTTKEDIIPRGTWSGLPYLFKEIQADSVPETGTYERQVTKKVTYIYEEATFKEESKTITRTINYLEKNNESNVVANPVVQNITVKRKIYTGKETGRVVEGPWEYRTDAYQPNWPRTNSPRVANFEAPDREVIDRVLVSQELVNNGNVVENVYYERIMPVGGDVVAKYVIEGTTTELKAATDVAKGLKVGKSYTSTAPVAGEELTATDGKVYVYKGHKATSAAETGTVTADKQEVVYEYAPKVGGNVEVKYVIAGTETNLKDPVTLVTNGQVGSDYTATKENTLTKDGLVYELVKTNNGLKEGSATETGKVTEAKQEVVYEYAPKVGGNVEVKYVIAGTETNLKDPVTLVTNGQVGSDYTATKENTLTKDGLVYELVKTNNGLKEGSATETGKVTEAKQEVVYEYAPKVGGNVEVKYVIAGTETNLKDPVTLVTNGQVGSDYTATKENTLTKDGLVYELVKTNNGLKEGSATETGKVTEAKQEVVYEYVPKVGGNVEVKYVIAGTETNLKDPVTLVTNGQVGSDYTATKENTITKDGLVYELVKTNNGLKEGSATETGKVTEAKQEVVYEYAPKVGGNVEVKYVIAGTETNLKDPVTLVTNGQVGSDYTATKENTLTKDGLVYELVKTNNGLKEGSATETGKVTEAKQEVVYEYAPKVGGNVEVKYVIAGTETNLKDPVTLVTNGQVGSDYTATKENTLTKDGLVYELVKTNNGLKEGSATETGKVTEAKQEVVYEYAPKVGGNVEVKYVIAGTETNLKDPVTLVTNGQVGSDYTATKENTLTKDGLVYELVKTNNGLKEGSATETGKVTEAKQEVVYEYVPKVGGNVEVKYVIAGTETNLKDPVTLVTNGQVGSDYTATKENTITKDGLVYELVKTNNGLKEGSATETGKVTEAKQEVVYEYAPKVGGNVEVKYVIAGTETNLKDPVTLVTNGQVGSDYTATKENTLTKDGLVYELVKTNNGLKEGSATETGKVTEAKQEVVYEYAPKVGGNVEVKYVIAGTETNLKDPVTLVTNGQVGSDYTATKENTITKDGLVYELVKTNNGLKEGSATETGKVTEAKQEVVYEYAPKVGGNVEVKYVIAGTETNLKDPVTLVTNGQVGSDYTATKENTLTKDGLVYELVKTNNGLKEGSATETGKVTEAKQEVVYEYVPKVGGNVEVKYVIAGTETNLKDPVTLVTNGQVGSDYTATKENTITKDGLVYELVKTNNGLKEGSATETGKVTEAKQEVVYEYVPKVGGNVEVKYVIAGTETNLKDPVTLVTNGQVGSDYTATKENTLTKDGLVYELVKTNNGLKEGSATETGKVTEAKQEVVYEYAPKVGGNVEVKYVIAGTETNLKDPVTLVTNGQVGSDYTATKENTITKDGLVYELVKTNNGLKEGSATETGKVTEAKQEVVYEYAPKVGGNVEVKYVIAGTETNLKDPVTLVTNGQVGSDYTATKDATITKEDGRVYKLVAANNGLKTGSAGEIGKVTTEKQTVTYEYELQKGDVTVNYTDTEGNAIEGKPSVKAETQSPTGKEYNTNTPDLKPETITTANGDVYEFVKKSETSASETGKVNEGVTTVEYVYRKVVTTYVDETGKEINSSDKGTKDKKDIPEYIFKETKKDEKGNTTHVYRQVVTTYVDETGKEINSSDKGTKDKKDIPEYIYKETKKDEKGNTTHVYRQVVTSYVDEEGKEINPSDKGTKDKKDIPEYIYKETKKDEKGNTTHVYRQVVTSYVDEEGKEINPSDKGTKDKKDIPEYIYKETKKDKDGNTTHVYRQVVTSYVDEEGKEINPSDKGTKDKKDIPEYIYKETKKDKDGNTTHVYRQVVTSYVDEEGKEINPSDKGTKDKKEISGYTFKQTKKDKDGNTIHVYTKKSSSTPETPKPTPETPNTDESKSTIWKSVDGQTLKPRENGTKDKSSIPGYEFVRTEKDKEGNTVHIYRKVTSSTPEVKEKETSYIDESGKEIRSPKKGTHPKETIPGYEFVRTETDANGNVRHVYRQVAQSSATVEKRKNELPNTGTGDEFTIFGAAAASILAGLGIAIPGKKKEE